MGAYLMKALREAKLHTSWINVNEPYEKACAEFLRHLLDRNADREPVPRRSAAVSAAGGDPGDLQLARAGRPEGHGARRPRSLPGDRAVGLRAGRSRQPPPRRLRRAPGAVSPSSRPWRARRCTARIADGPRASGRRHAEAAGDDARPRPPASPSRPLRGRAPTFRSWPRVPARATSSPSPASPATDAPPSRVTGRFFAPREGAAQTPADAALWEGTRLLLPAELARELLPRGHQ